MSLLRFSGLIVGILFLFIVFIRLRSYETSRSTIWLFGALGLSLALFSIFPDLLNVPSKLVYLEKIKGGRIITVIVIYTIILGIFLFKNQKKIYKINQKFNWLVERLVVKEFDGLESFQETEKNMVLVVVPAYNEAENLKVLLHQIPRSIFDHTVKVLVVNDGSTDGTEEVARQQGAWVINHPFNMGGGMGIHTGYNVAMLLDIKVVVTMDGDGQHKPEQIPLLVEPIIKNEADIVIGSRRLGTSEATSVIRSLGVVLYSGLVTLLIGKKITDCSSGFRAFNLVHLKGLRLFQEQYHTTELIIDAAKAGLRIVERPITITDRFAGTTKKGWTPAYAWGVLSTIIRTWLR